MSLYILDTDHLTLHLHGHPQVSARVEATPENHLELRKELPRLGKLDLSIAAITLEHQGILVSRNRRDFEQVSGLVIEDWSKP